MLGLSITAIGLRPIQDCLAIFDQLQQPMQLEFLELAIGSHCATELTYPNVPLILHDSCLYHQGYRRRLLLNQPRSWAIYTEFVATHPVAALSLHAPLQRDCSRTELEKSLKSLEQTLQIPVFVEVMPSPEYWCSSPETLVEHPLLLDISHVLIWHQGNQAQTQATCQQLLQTVAVGALHLSHNNGKADAHDLIPANVWFAPYITDWSKRYLVTYESLPEMRSAYERLDKKRRNLTQFRSSP